MPTAKVKGFWGKGRFPLTCFPFPDFSQGVPREVANCYNLQGVIAADVNLTQANLCSANLSESDLSEAYLVRGNLNNANLCNANLTRAESSSVNWIGATPRGARMPDGKVNSDSRATAPIG